MYFLLAVVLLIIIYFYLIAPTFRKHPDREIFKNSFFAHRGLHSDFIPENSISAFSKAVEKGYGIELDIHITRDGEIVVFHDESLLRMCGVDQKVEELTLEELKRYNLSNTDEKIPTFKDVLALVDGRVPLIIEFKSMKVNNDLLCETANEILSNYNGKYCVESFNPFAVSWYKKHRKDIFRGQLAQNTKKKQFIAKISSAFFLNFLVRPDFIAFEEEYSNNLNFKIQKLFGAFCIGWTFESQEEINKKKNEFSAFIFEKFNPKI